MLKRFVKGCSFLWCVVCAVSLCLSPSAQAQPVFGVGDENPWSESSMSPFEVRISGVIKSSSTKEPLAEVKLGIAQFHEEYRFDITSMNAPAFPQVSARQMLPRKGSRQYDFNLIGPRDLLSKIAQAQPDTPLRIVGMYVRRDQRLQLVSVEVMGEDEPDGEGK
jgi:hypothetical protein